LALNAGNSLSQMRVNCACMFPVCAAIAITASYLEERCTSIYEEDSFFYVLMLNLYF
jgi:hypothetical protein